jgi:hypothetical protein
MLVGSASAGFDGVKKVVTLEEAKVSNDGFDNSKTVKEENVTVPEKTSVDYSESDYGASMVQKGLDLAVISLADGIASIWKDNRATNEFNKNSIVTEEYGATRGAIFTFVTVNPEPDKIGPIQKFESESKAVWAFLVCVFILGFVMFANIARANKSAYSYSLGDHDFSDSRFIGGSILCMAAYLAPKAVLVSLDLCTALSQFAMLNVLDYIEPSLENAYLYFMMTLGETLVAVFFIVRPWIIDIAYAASRLVVVIYFMGFFQDEIRWAFSKYVKVLLLQPVCIFFSCVCLIAVKWAGMENASGAYIIMFLFIAWINYKWMFSNFGVSTVKHIAKTAAYRM